MWLLETTSGYNKFELTSVFTQQGIQLQLDRYFVLLNVLLVQDSDSDVLDSKLDFKKTARYFDVASAERMQINLICCRF